MLGTWLALCGTGGVVAQPTDSHPAVTTAHELIGVPYRYGAVGDVLFFRQRGKLSHVALYVGDGHFIHAPSSGRQVERVPLEGYWRTHLIGVGRFR